MRRLRNINILPHGQRGAVLIWFALLLPVLMGFAALAIDVALIYQTRIELQNAADAAALAGALSVTGPDTKGKYNYQTGTNNASALARTNFVRRIYRVTQITPEPGAWVLTSASPAWIATTTPAAGQVPAIRVTILLSSNGGPLPLFFAPVLGFANSNFQVTAIAARSQANRSVLVQ
jgi:Flp pilus assembly protein TadG